MDGDKKGVGSNKKGQGPDSKLTWQKYIKTLIPWLVIGLGMAWYFSQT